MTVLPFTPFELVYLILLVISIYLDWKRDKRK